MSGPPADTLDQATEQAIRQRHRLAFDKDGVYARDVGLLLQEVDRLRKAILAFGQPGSNPAGFDWAVLGRIDELERENERLRESLRMITRQGGNLSDDNLTSKTGPNDAAHRGLMYVGARQIAREALEDVNHG